MVHLARLHSKVAVVFFTLLIFVGAVAGATDDPIFLGIDLEQSAFAKFSAKDMSSCIFTLLEMVFANKKAHDWKLKSTPLRDLGRHFPWLNHGYEFRVEYKDGREFVGHVWADVDVVKGQEPRVECQFDFRTPVEILSSVSDERLVFSATWGD